MVLRTNLDATFLLSQHFGKAMVSRGRGKIINIASLLSFGGGITVPAYTASKHAVAGVTALAFLNSVPNNHASVRDRSLPLNRTGIRVALEVQERVLGP